MKHRPRMVFNELDLALGLVAPLVLNESPLPAAPVRMLVSTLNVRAVKQRPGKKGKPGPGPNGTAIMRADPTRTFGLAQGMVRKLAAKFAALKGDIYKFVVVEDAFGLKDRPHTVAAVTGNAAEDELRDERGRWTAEGSRLPTAKELAEHISGLKEGEGVVVHGVNIHKQIERRAGGDLHTWWVQAGGGIQFSKSPEAAARKAVALMRHAEKEAGDAHPTIAMFLKPGGKFDDAGAYIEHKKTGEVYGPFRNRRDAYGAVAVMSGASSMDATMTMRHPEGGTVDPAYRVRGEFDKGELSGAAAMDKKPLKVGKIKDLQPHERYRDTAKYEPAFMYGHFGSGPYVWPTGNAAGPSEAALREADFVTFPDGIKGTTCLNCQYVQTINDGPVCTHPKLLGVPVAKQNTCAYWDAEGVRRPFPHAKEPMLRYQPPVENAAEDQPRDDHGRFAKVEGKSITQEITDTFPEGPRREHARSAAITDSPRWFDVHTLRDDDGKLVGVASLWNRPDHASPGMPTGSYLRIGNMATAAAGHGRKLMEKLIGVARSHDAGLELTDTEASSGFYAKMGFKKGENAGTWYLTAKDIKGLITNATSLSRESWIAPERSGRIPLFVLKAAGFVTLPAKIEDGTNCSSCEYNRADDAGDGRHCGHKKIAGQPISDRDCCSYWWADGTTFGFGDHVENYDPSQPRDEHGKWALGGADATTMFHSTTSKALRKILKEGIRPQTKHNFKESDYYSTPERARAVYVTRAWNQEGHERFGNPYDITEDYAFQQAFEYAKHASDRTGWAGVVLVLNVPKSESRKFEHDSMAGEYAEMADIAIKPEWIVGVSKINPNEDSLFKGPQKVVPVHNEEHVRYYVAVHLPLDPDEATENYDPDEERDEHGRWTGGGGQTSSPRFKAWFGDSKVMTPDGKPLVVYHGSRSDFAAFQTDVAGDRHAMFDRAMGSHFAEDPAVTDAFTTGEYAASHDYAVSEDSERSWYREGGEAVWGKGVPVLVTKDAEGNRKIETYDPKVHGGTWGIADRHGPDARLEMVMPGGNVAPVYLKIEHPLVVESKVYPKSGNLEMDQTAISRVAGGKALAADRDLFVAAYSTTGRKDGGEVWDQLHAGKTYQTPYGGAYHNFEDVVEDFSGMLNGGTLAGRAKAVLERLGYDGIKYVNTSGNEVRKGGNPTAWIAFRPTQIKSAIGNRGTFNPADPDVRNYNPDESRDEHGRWTPRDDSSPEVVKAAANFVRRWSLTPGSNVPKQLPSRDVQELLSQSRPSKPITLFRWERADHDPAKTDMSTKVPLQSWTTFGDIAKETVRDLNEDVDKGVVKGPRWLLLQRTFQPREIFADFAKLPRTVKDSLREMGEKPDTPGGVSGLGEVLVHYSRELQRVGRDPYFQLNYNPDESRDEHGRWSKGGAAATSQANSILRAAGHVPGHILHAVRERVKAKYAALEARYGPGYAKAIIGAALVGLPIPVPGASLATSAMAVGLAELHRALAGPPVRNAEDEPRDERGRWIGGGTALERVPVEQFSYRDKDDDHLYHVTSEPTADKIVAGQVLKKTGGLVGRGGYAGHSAGGVFLTERSGVKFWMDKVEDHLFDQHDDPPAVAVVRVPRSLVADRLTPDEIGTKDAGYHKAYKVSGKIEPTTNGYVLILNDEPEAMTEDEVQSAAEQLVRELEAELTGQTVNAGNPDQARDEHGRFAAGTSALDHPAVAKFMSDLEAERLSGDRAEEMGNAVTLEGVDSHIVVRGGRLVGAMATTSRAGVTTIHHVGSLAKGVGRSMVEGLGRGKLVAKDVTEAGRGFYAHLGFRPSRLGQDDVMVRDRLTANAEDDPDRPFAVAVDFDGRIVETDRTGHHLELDRVVPRPGVRAALEAFRRAGIKIVVWTSRPPPDAPLAAWMRAHKLPFDEVNNNAGTEDGSRKMFADVYLDDRGENDPDAPWPELVDIVMRRFREYVGKHPEARQPHKTKRALYEAAPYGLNELREVLSAVGLQVYELAELSVGGVEALANRKGTFALLVPLKGEERANEKVSDEYGGDWSRLLDVVRATVAADTLDQLHAARAKVEAKLGPPVREKDRFAQPLPNGYRDHLCTYRLPTGGLLAEVQYHLKPILAARERQHMAYGVIRAIRGSMREEGRRRMTEGEKGAVRHVRKEGESLLKKAWEEVKADDPTANAGWEDEARDERGKWTSGGGTYPVPTLYHTFRSQTGGYSGGKISGGGLFAVAGYKGFDPFQPNEYGDRVLALYPADVPVDKVYKADDQFEALKDLFGNERAKAFSRRLDKITTEDAGSVSSLYSRVDSQIAHELRKRGYWLIHYTASEQYGEEWSVLDKRAIRATQQKGKPETTNNALLAHLLTENAGDFAFESSPEQVEKFTEWLRERTDMRLTGDTDRKLWEAYARAGFERGAGRAFDDVNRKRTAMAAIVPEGFERMAGSREQFLRSAFGQPETVEKLQLLASRSFADLVNVTHDMTTRMRRSLTDGLARGANPREIADDMYDDLGIGYRRSEVIARTEIIRAHAEGQLDAFEDMGVEEIGVAVEYSTAGDERVCDLCEDLEGVVLSIQEAHGVIPVHPQCRCSFLPANLGEDRGDQIRSKRGIDAAFKEAGFDKRVSKDRPEAIINWNPDQPRDPHGEWTSGGGPNTSLHPHSPEFKAWFHGSKVVDKHGAPKHTASSRLEGDVGSDGDDGQPLVVFHGTPHGAFDEFRDDKIANPNDLYYGPGHYFTEDVAAAEMFAKTQHSGADKPEVMRLFLSIKHPFDLDNDTVSSADLSKAEQASIRQQIVTRAFQEDGRSEALEAGRDFDRLGVKLSYEQAAKTYGIGKDSLRKVIEGMGHDGMTVRSPVAPGGDPAHSRFWIAFRPTQIKATDAKRFDPASANIHNAAEDEPRDERGRWTTGGSAVASLPQPWEVDRLSESDNKKLMRGLIQKHGSDEVLRGASLVAQEYSGLNQTQGLLVRKIVELAGKGQTLDQIKQTAAKEFEAYNGNIYSTFRMDGERLQAIVDAAPAYYQALKDVKPSPDVVYRGAKGSPRGDTFKMDGPTAFSHSVDSAMTYSGGVLLEVEPGAKMLPTRMLANVNKAVEANNPAEREHATAPAFYKRSESKIHPLGIGHGFSIDFDTDRELTSSGTFKVLGREKKPITFKDTTTGNTRTKTVNVIRVRQVGLPGERTDNALVENYDPDQPRDAHGVFAAAPGLAEIAPEVKTGWGRRAAELDQMTKWQLASLAAVHEHEGGGEHAVADYMIMSHRELRHLVELQERNRYFKEHGEVINYSPEQPRDPDGRFAGGAGREAAGHEGHGHTAGKPGHVVEGVRVTPPPPPAHGPGIYAPDPTADRNGDGVPDAARVGVPAFSVPPPPPIGRLPNLTPHERAVEKAFIDHYEADPDGVAGGFRNVIVRQAQAEGATPKFSTDDAKKIAEPWVHPDMETRAENRATLNNALHQTANAIAKRAFLQQLDRLRPGDHVLVTCGGCGAGKTYALGKVPEAKAIADKAKVVWDSAGDQNSSENPWVQDEAERRGLKVDYVYVHANPYDQWANKDRGVVKRAGDPDDGRMVDARVFADSYAIGGRAFHGFYQSNERNPNATFTFLDNTGTPKLMHEFPKADLHIDRDELLTFAKKTVTDRDVPIRVKFGALAGDRIWGSGHGASETWGE